MDARDCARCKQVLSNIVVTCKGGDMIFCSTECHNMMIKSHKKVCSGYNKFTAPKKTGVGLHQSGPLPTLSSGTTMGFPPPTCFGATMGFPHPRSLGAPRGFSPTPKIGALRGFPTPQSFGPPRGFPPSQRIAAPRGFPPPQSGVPPLARGFPLTQYGGIHPTQCSNSTPSFKFGGNGSSQSPTEQTSHISQPHTVVDHVNSQENTQDSQMSPNKLSDSGSIFDVEKQPRDKHGKFGSTGAETKSKERSEEQLAKDKRSSNIAKWKKAAVKNMQKIQKETPEVTQLYTLESNKARGRKNPIVYKTEGYDPRVRSANSVSNRSLGEVGAELENFGGDTMAGLVSSRCRLSDTLCFVCKTRLGPEVPKRIVCTKKDCFRGTAHIACLNLKVPKAYIARFRCWYMCPFHRAESQASELGDDEEDKEEEGEVTSDPGRTLALPAGNRGKKKNENISRPKKLSDSLMVVLDTTQKYLTYNEIRSLLSKYKDARKLQVVEGKIIPDDQLATVLGRNPFRITEAPRLLRETKSISES